MVILFKNHYKNFGFFTYTWLQRKKGGVEVKVLHQQRGPSEVATVQWFSSWMYRLVREI